MAPDPIPSPAGDTHVWWQLDPRVTFLNHGSFGACAGPVLDAQQRWRAELERQPVDFLERRIDGLVGETRGQVAAFLGADPDGLAFVPNATTGVNTVLRRLGLGSGDAVVIGDHAYPAVWNAARTVCAELDVALDIVRIPLPLPSDDDVVAAFAGAITERTALVVVDHVTSATAAVMPVERIVEACRARGVPVLVDAAHAVAMLEVDVDPLGADFWVGNFHKWLCAPKGAGALWVADRWRDRMRPLVTSHEHLRTFHQAFDWTGTYDPTAILSVPAAIDFLAEFGWEDMRERNHDLVCAGRALVNEAVGRPILVPDDRCGWMAIVALPDGVATTREEARALTARMAGEHRVEVPFVHRPGGGFVRLSAHLYNTIEDFERVSGVLPAILRG